MGSERGECRGGQTDTVFMAERNVSENAKRGAIDGRTDGGTDGGGTQTDGGSGGGRRDPSLYPASPSLARSLVTLAASTLHMRSGSKARREGRKEGRSEEIRAAALLPQHCGRRRRRRRKRISGPVRAGV